MEQVHLQKNPQLIKKLSQDSKDSIFVKNNIMPFYVKKTILSRQGKYFKSGHWSNKQKMKFCAFMQFFNQIFNQRGNRKSLKIYKVMSSFIKTKNPDQCRSFHQKIQAKSLNMLYYTNKIKQKIGTEKYAFNYKLYSHQLNSLDLVTQPLTLQQAQFEMKKAISSKKQKSKTEQYKNFCFGEINVAEIQNKYRSNAFEAQIKKQEDLKEGRTGATTVPQNPQNGIKQFQQWSNRINQQDNKQQQGRIEQNQKIANPQMSQIVSQCNFYWQKWLKATLKLQQIRYQTQARFITD